MTPAERLVVRFEAAWSAADMAQEFADTCAAGPALRGSADVQGPAARPGRAGRARRRLRTAAPDARVEGTGPRLTDGRFVAAPCKLLGTHTGELEGLPPTGRELVVQAVLYCELDEARTRLWRVRAFFDLYDAATQLGVLPKPGSLGQKALMLHARLRAARYSVTVIVPFWPGWIVQT